jgi:hypothetical protein
MNSGLAAGVVVDEVGELADSIKAFVIPAKKMEMIAPNVPPQASILG